MNKKDKKGFTLAEVLITLAIIGTIAAILFPSILANYTERTFNARRQALHARMSQAMAELADKFPNYEDANCDAATGRCTDVASALKFISEGLSKTYKISAICDYDTISSCDIPETVTKVDGSKFNLKARSKTFITYIPHVMHRNFYNPAVVQNIEYDTNSAAFMTKNGESVLLFFNPRCKAKEAYTTISRMELEGGIIYKTSDAYMCVNMVYDLNGGKKKPNRIGEDVGFMTVFYSDAPYVVAPKIVAPNEFNIETVSTESTTHEVITENKTTYSNAKAACHALGENIVLPSYEQMASIALNFPLYRDEDEFTKAASHDAVAERIGGGYYWTSTPCGGPNLRLSQEVDYSSISDESTIFCSDSADSNNLRLYTCVYDN